MIPDTIGGLPTHSLLVHFVVVLLPLAVLVFVATGWRANLSRTYALPAALLAMASLVAAFIAAQTGEALQEQVRNAAGSRVSFGDHPSDGNLARNLAILFAVVAVAFWASTHWQERLKLPSWAPTAIYAFGSLLGVIVIVTVISAGHSGSALVWRDLGTFVQPK